jgi:hypothetical protein
MVPRSASSRVQLRKACAHAVRPGKLAAVRNSEQAAACGDAERGGELGGRPAALVVAESEPHDPSVRVPRGEPGERPRVKRMLGPVRRDDHADADTGGT